MSYLDSMTEKQWLQSIHERMKERTKDTFSLAVDEVLTEALLKIYEAITGLGQLVQAIPAPVVNVPQQVLPAPVVQVQPQALDFSDLVKAIQNVVNVYPGPTAQDIAEAIVPLIQNVSQNTLSTDLAKTLEQLSVNLKNMPGRAWSIGGGNVTPVYQGGILRNGVEVSVTTSATLLIAAYDGRKKLIIQNNGAANVRVGAEGVTATTGLRLLPNAVAIFDMPHVPTSAVYAISESGTNLVLVQAIE